MPGKKAAALQHWAIRGSRRVNIASRAPSLPHTVSSVHPSAANSEARSGASATEIELVELRRLHARADEHGMGLAAMMDLVLEQVQEQPVAALGLDARIPVQSHSGAERLLRQGLADGNQPPIDGRLLALQVRHRGAGRPVGPRLRAEPAALQAVDVEPVDDQDVVERRLEARKEAGPRAPRTPLASGRAQAASRR